jgi:hypothetical protein
MRRRPKDFALCRRSHPTRTPSFRSQGNRSAIADPRPTKLEPAPVTSATCGNPHF